MFGVSAVVEYGLVAKQKKTYSLETSVVIAVDREAKYQGIHPSTYVNDVLLKATREQDARRLGEALKTMGETNNDGAD